MMDGSGGNGSVVPASFNVHQHLSEATRLFQQNSYPSATPFGGHMGSHPGNHHQLSAAQSQQNPHLAAAVAAMGQQHGGMGQMQHGLTGTSQQIAAALFANSPLISDDLKLAAAAAAAAAAAQSARGKKTHRAEPVPQSGFKGVSWNSRMKAWLAFYVTENGERKSKTFSTRKLGMEEARLQAIAFCKQKQDQRREARKRNRELQNQHCAGGLDKHSSDESMMDSPGSGLGHLLPTGGQQGNSPGGSSSSSNQSSLRCGYPTTPGMGMMSQNSAAVRGLVHCTIGWSQATNGSEIAYVPIVPIAMDMIQKSGLLQPLELNVLPPCQHCNKQPYPFLMIVSEGQEQTYSGNSIVTLASNGQGSVTIPQTGDPRSRNPMSPLDSPAPTTPNSEQNAPTDGGDVKSMAEGQSNKGGDYAICTIKQLNEDTGDSDPMENGSGFNLGRHLNGKLKFSNDQLRRDCLSPSTSSSDPTSFSPSGALLAMSEAQLQQSQHLLNHQLSIGDAQGTLAGTNELIEDDEDNDVMQSLGAYGDDRQLLGLGSVDMEGNDRSGMLSSL